MLATGFGSRFPWKQYAWDSPPAGTDLTFLGIAGGRYIDAPAVRYYDSDTDGQDIATHYFVNDANMNVTALLDTSGGVVERYEYDAYGRVHFLSADFTSKATQASAYASDSLGAGYLPDAETGLYHERFRTYPPGVGRWRQRDKPGKVPGLRFTALLPPAFGTG